jgi:hypothetical protein
MTRKLLLTFVAAAALAGCNSKDHTIVAGGPDDGNVANVPQNVTLPPSITASKSYRCKNNKVLYVDWLSDGSANVKPSKDGAGTPVPAGSADLSGDAKASAITYKGESCKS